MWYNNSLFYGIYNYKRVCFLRDFIMDGRAGVFKTWGHKPDAPLQKAKKKAKKKPAGNKTAMKAQKKALQEAKKANKNK